MDHAWSRELPPRPCRPYSVLLPVGFAVPPPLPETRCALTAPFHPYPRGLSRSGGLLSVALSLGSPPAAVSRHRRSLEPGLSSTGRIRPRSLIARQRPSGQLATAIRGRGRDRSRGVTRGRTPRAVRCRFICDIRGERSDSARCPKSSRHQLRMGQARQQDRAVSPPELRFGAAAIPKLTARTRAGGRRGSTCR